jgi:hypothetical protein
VIYLVLAAIVGLMAGVSLAGELNAEVTTVDGLIVGTHTGRIRGSSGASTTTYHVEILRLDTVEEESVHNAPLYDAYEANGETDVTLDIIDVGSGVDRISAVHYLGRTYVGTSKAEGIGVSIAFIVLAVLFLALGIRRLVVVRRRPTPTWAAPAPNAPTYPQPDLPDPPA